MNQEQAEVRMLELQTELALVEYERDITFPLRFIKRHRLRKRIREILRELASLQLAYRAMLTPRAFVQVPPGTPVPITDEQLRKLTFDLVESTVGLKAALKLDRSFSRTIIPRFFYGGDEEAMAATVTEQRMSQWAEPVRPEELEVDRRHRLDFELLTGMQ